MSPRQPNINPRTNRPDVNAGQSQRIGGNWGQNINRMPQQGNAINGNANRPSANDRFDRGTKHLSHIGGGGAGAKLYRINKAEDDMSRRKVGGIMLDADIIQDANQQKLDDSKNKRKNVIIIVLSMLLAISLAYLAIAIFGYVQNSKAENCRYNISTEVPAYWLIEGGRETKFAVREGLRSNTVYEINTSMVIESDDYVDIEVIITVTVNGKEIYISGLYEASDNMVRVENKNTWKYIGGHQGAGEVYLFGGLDFFGAPDGLNSTSVNINIYAEVTRVDN